MKGRLTERSIRTLSTPKVQMDILHERTPSAGLRLSPSGTRLWFFIYRSPAVRDGQGGPKQRRAYLGFHPSGRRPDRSTEGRELEPMTLEQFERAYDIFRGELAKGCDPREVRPVQAAASLRVISPEAVPVDLRGLFPEGYREGTFAALVFDYFQHCARPNLKPRTFEGYRQAARAFVSLLGSYNPADITSKDVRMVLSRVERTAPQMVRNVKKVLSVVLGYGVTEWHLAANAARGVKVTVKKGKRSRWLTDEEIALTLEALPLMSDRKAADVYTLILASMCRPGEAAYAEAESIIEANGERVWKILGKNGREILVPLIGPIGEVLERRYREVGGKGPLFWRGNPGKFYPRELTAANAEFRELTNLKDIRPHDLRRTGRTHISGLGVSEAVAEALLNHAKGEIEGTYNLYSYWPERKAALALWHEKLSRVRVKYLRTAA